MTPATTAAHAIAELMAAWDKIMAAARQQFPGASEEKLYQIAKAAMNNAMSKQKPTGSAA